MHPPSEVLFSSGLVCVYLCSLSPAFPCAVPVSLTVLFQCLSPGLFSFRRPISHAAFFSAACARVPLRLCASLFLSAKEAEGKIEVLNGTEWQTWKSLLEMIVSSLLSAHGSKQVFTVKGRLQHLCRVPVLGMKTSG